MKILASEWRSSSQTVGFIAYDTGFDGQWNSVVGYRPLTELEIEAHIYLSTTEADEQYIADHGAKLEWQLAQILFPWLDITKHKYYTGPEKK